MLCVPAASRPFRRLRNLLIGLQISLLVFSMAAPAGTIFAATIQTDLWVYQHGDTVTVTGTDFGPDETVTVVTTDPAGTEVDRGTTQAGPDGSITYAFVLSVTIPGIYDVVATGDNTGLTAATQFDPPALAVSPTSVAFGSQTVGTTSSPMTITISNGPTGTALNAIVVTSSDPAQFPINTAGMATSLAAGASTTFTVRFAPSSSGAKSGSLTIKSNAPDATVNLSGTGVAADQPPVAVDDSSTVSEDSGANAINVLANDTDVDGGPKSVASVGSAAHGTTAVSGGGTGVSYTPAVNYCGSDSFTYSLNGGSSATVSVTVTCVDDAPVAVDDTATVGEDSGVNSVNVLANDTDVDGGPKSVASVGSASHGATAITAGGTGVSYSPAANFCGGDSFTYTLNGGSSATVSVTVTCSDDAPIAVDDAATVEEDSSANTIDVLANDTDVDAGPKAVASVGSAGHGTTAITGGGTGLSYTPALNFCGSDSFTYTLNGGSTATVSVTVNCVDDAPTAVGDSATVAEDSGANAIDVLANDTDVDGGPKAVASVGPAGHGATAVDGGGTGVSYTPASNYCGSDTFTYTLNGGSTGTVSVSVTCVADPPVAVDDTATTAEDQGVDIDVTANDTDADADALTVDGYDSTSANGGLVVLNADGTLRYLPAANFFGVDTFTYTVSDGGLGSNVATVTITVTPVNDAPVANDDTTTTDEDVAVAVDVLVNDTDVDNAAGDLSVDSFTQGAHGSVAPGLDGSLVYTPSANYNGPDSFTYVITDGDLFSAFATVSVTVSPVNDPPILDAIGDQSVDEETLLAFPATASDVDGDGLTFNLGGTVPAGASITAGGLFSWTPTEVQGPGSYTFDVVVSDGDLQDSEAITVTVHEVNVAPVLTPIGAQTVEEGSELTFDALATDHDLPANGLTFSLSGAPAGATIDPSTGEFSWTPTDDALVSFTVVVTDDGSPARFDSELVTVTVTNVAPTASITGAPSTSPEGTAINLGSIVADPSSVDQAAGFTYAWSVTKNGGAYASGSLGTFAFTPDDNGTYVVSLTATDKDGGVGTATQKTINVTNVNPIVGTITLTGNSGTSCLAGNSVELRFTFGDAGTIDNTWVVDIDWGDGSPHGSANLTSQAGTFGPYTHTYPAGSFTPTVRITDKDGGVGTSSTSSGAVSLLYATTGFLQPINIAGQRSSFKIGSTIPVKLQATDCTGASVPGLVLTVHLAKVDPSAESVNEIVSSSAADSGTTMRYDSTGRQYIFNLSTKSSQFNAGQDLTTGTYHLWVTGALIAQIDATFDARK